MSNNYIDNLSVDCVIFGYKDEELKVLLMKRNFEPSQGMYALPGDFVYENEELVDASRRILYQRTGLEDLFLQQVHTFGELNRFPLRRVVTVAYYALVNIEDHLLVPGDEVSDLHWFSVNDLPELPFDHKKIFDHCFDHLRKIVKKEPVGFNLLPEKFSITELQKLYEAIWGTELDKRNFRKKLSKMDVLIDLNEKQQNVSHRAAKLYKFDGSVYEHLKQQGVSFEL